MTAFVADTHAVVWYLLASPALSASAKAAFESAAKAGDPIYVSTISVVELIYLAEKGKLPSAMPETLLNAIDDDESVLVLAPLERLVLEALPQVSRAQVPDMPDRIIAATALAYGLPLITRDHKIQVSSVMTVW